MLSKGILFVVALATASSLVELGESAAAKEAPSKRSKYYERINEHLVKHVHSDNPEANMAEASNWLSKGLLSLHSSDLQHALKNFVLMPQVTANRSMCKERSMDVLDANERGLFSPARLEQDNYSRQRIDKLIEHYFQKFIDVCPKYVEDVWRGHGSFGWKIKAYEKINDYLESNEIETKDVQKAMDELQKWAMELRKENPDGALTDALRQLLAMKSAVGKDKCTYEAYQILLRNEAATKQRGAGGAILETKQLVYDFRRQHRVACRDVYPQKFQSAIGRLNEATLRSVLILTGEFFFQYEDFKPFVESINNQTKYTQIKSDFTTPELVTLLTRSKSVWTTSRGLIRYIRKFYTTQVMLFRALKYMVGKTNPDFKYLTSHRNELDEHVPTDAAKVHELHERYMVNPCKRYLNAVDKEVITLEAYDQRIPIGDHEFDLRPDEFEPKLGFVLGQSAAALCHMVVDDADEHRDLLVDMANSISLQWMHNDI